MTDVLPPCLDGALNLFKWPAAVVAFALLPGSIIAFSETVLLALFTTVNLEFFLSGVIIYVLVWHKIFKKHFADSWFSTLEHELIHAFFQWPPVIGGLISK